MKNHIDLIKKIGKIKRIRRSGWVRENIPDPESVADHSYRVAVMAMIFGKHLNTDVDKLIKMILLHDLGEGTIGDKVVERGVRVDSKSREKKDKEEVETIRQMFSSIENGNSFAQLQEESSRMQTREAKILKQLERLEMAVQALEYEEEYGKDLTEFFDNASMHINEEYLIKLLEIVKSLRPKAR